MATQDDAMEEGFRYMPLDGAANLPEDHQPSTSHTRQAPASPVLTPDEARRNKSPAPLPPSGQQRDTRSRSAPNSRSSTPTASRPQPAPFRRKPSEKLVRLPTNAEELANYQDMEVPDNRGRVSAYCTSEGFDRQALERKLHERGTGLHSTPDVLHSQWNQPGHTRAGDVFYFDYGCVVFWGLSQEQEAEILSYVVGPCQEDSLPEKARKAEHFRFHYAVVERPNICNDTITISAHQSSDHLIKLSIAHALAQSTKLLVFEQRASELVASTTSLQEEMAETGHIGLSSTAVAQLIGRVFLQQSAINLLCSIMDTPEFFWSAPDYLQDIYKAVREYLELDDRVEVLNSRLGILQEMLDLVRVHKNTGHAAQLEWIIIWLVFAAVLVDLFELASIFGLIGVRTFP